MNNANKIGFVTTLASLSGMSGNRRESSRAVRATPRQRLEGGIKISSRTLDLLSDAQREALGGMAVSLPVRQGVFIGGAFCTIDEAAQESTELY